MIGFDPPDDLERVLLSELRAATAVPGLLEEPDESRDVLQPLPDVYRSVPANSPVEFE